MAASGSSAVNLPLESPDLWTKLSLLAPAPLHLAAWLQERFES